VAPVRLRLALVPGLRPPRADARPRGQERRWLSPLQHRADGREPAPHHPRGGWLRHGRPPDHAGGQPARHPRPPEGRLRGPRVPPPRHCGAAVPASFRARGRNRGRGRLARQRPAPRGLAAAAAGGAGEAHRDQQQRQRGREARGRGAHRRGL
ncbi:MAG: Heat shock protein, Hsp20 family, partial [uncultured Acetobacteraceae bacterium]